MRITRSGIVFSVASITLAALAGCSSATPEAAASSHVSAAPTANTASANSGNTHILVYSINTDGPSFRSVVTGAIGDYGPALTVLPDGKPDPSQSSQLELKLTRGSFRIDITALDKAFVKATSNEPIYSGTCSDFVRVTATAHVVKHSGTGSYQRISGSFQMTASLDEVEAHSCKKGSPANFLWQVISLSGSGTVIP
jgi:hypothetical protein